MRNIASLCAVLMLLCTLAFGQTRKVTGQVKDERGDPVPFASVKIQGTTRGVSADANGFFAIEVSGNDRVLVISSQGLQEKSFPVGNNNVIDVQLASTGQLKEVVITTALGQTQRKTKTGYSTATFNNESINKIAPVSVLDGLQGKIAGAEISTTGGQPGSSSKVILRGYGVIGGGGNQPLYVIDGVPLSDARLGSSDADGLDFGNGLNDINPNDVENITVLKGTAAASLYGSQARNGAILITTKRGRAGKLKVEFSSSVNITSVGKLPDPQKTFGQGWGGVFILSENGSWGPRYDGKERLWGSVVDNSQLLKPFSHLEDNVRDFYDYGREFNNSIGLSGGNEITNFYFSYGNINSDGVIPSRTDYLDRHTFALRTNSKFDGFTIGTSFNYINRRQNASVTQSESGVGSSIFEDILQIPNDVPIKDFRDYKNKFFNVDNYFTPFAENPYYGLFENGSQQNSDRFFGNLDLGYKFTDWLSAQLRIGGDFANARTFIWKAKNIPSPGSWNDGANPEGAQRQADVGSVQEQTNFAGLINGDFILKANKDLGDDFSLEVIAGTNYYQQSSKGTVARVEDLKIPGFYNLSNSSNKPTASDARSRRRNIGFYGQAIVGYKDYLYLTLNARNDWSSTLPIENNNFFYPGANISWVASKTFDLSNTPISLLKIRGGYGKTGADPTPYLVYSTLVPGSIGLGFGNITFPYDGVSAFELGNQIGNLDLQPIITKEFEIGAEVRFFANKFGIDATYYDKQTEGQIFAVPISPATGYTGLVSNLGLVTNKGIELTLDGAPVSSKDFSWNVLYTFTRNRSNVVSLTQGLDKISLNTAYDAEFNVRPGFPVGVFEAPVPKMTEDGRIIVNPATGMPEVADTKGFFGDAQRDFTMGLSNTLTYKGFSVGFSLDYRKGGMFYSGTADLYQFTGNSYVTTYNDRRPFIIPNSVYEQKDANGQPVLDPNGKPVYLENTTVIDEGHMDTYYYHTTNKAFSYYDRIIDASFLKLKDVTLGYSLPKTWASRIKANNLSLTLYARNFILWTPRSNIYIDPEATNFGNDLASQFGEFRTGPTLKSFGVALKAIF